jgi:hypothetical protein
LDEVRQMAAAGAPLTSISVDASDHFYALRELTNPPALNDSNFRSAGQIITEVTLGVRPHTFTSINLQMTYHSLLQFSNV